MAYSTGSPANARAVISNGSPGSPSSTNSPFLVPTSSSVIAPRDPNSLRAVLLAIDQGTTGTTCLVFDLQGELIGRAYREFTQHFPRPGWVEHDAAEIWDVTHAVAGEALDDAGAEPGELEAIGITNQRETVVCWDPSTGEPLHRALVWQDRRTAGRCDELREAGEEARIRERTGLVLDPYFSATKIEWLLRNVDGLAQKAREGRAVFGTIDSWLLFKLTGEHVTDPTNASRTLLYDIRREPLGPRAARPLRRARALAARGAAELRRARARATDFHGHEVPVSGVAGDQQAALFGQRCLEPGLGKNTYGTGSFVLLNPGTSAPPPTEGLLSTVAWQIGRADHVRARGGDLRHRRRRAVAARRAAGSSSRPAETEALAASLDSNDGVYFVPGPDRARLAALGPVRARDDRRASRAAPAARTSRARRSRRWPTRRSTRCARWSAGGSEPLAELRADGAATVNRWLMQFQADVLGVPVVVPGGRRDDGAGRGAAGRASAPALLTLDQVTRMGEERARYEPRMGEDERESLLDGWHRALDARARLGVRMREEMTEEKLAPMQGAGLQGPASRRALRHASTSARARASPNWVYEAVRIVTSLYAWIFFRARGIDAEKVPAERPGDPRAEPLLVHGPLLPRRLDPPQGPVHGQVAAVQAADAVDLHARRRVPGAARLRRRGGVHHRAQHPRRAAATIAMYCEGGRSRTGKLSDIGAARHRPAGAAVGRDRSCRSRSTAPRRCATGSGCSSRR